MPVAQISHRLGISKVMFYIYLVWNHGLTLNPNCYRFSKRLQATI